MPPRPPRRDDGRRGLDGAPLGGETPDDYAPVARPPRPPVPPTVSAARCRARATSIDRTVTELRGIDVPEALLEPLSAFAVALRAESTRLTATVDTVHPEAERVSAWDDLGGRP